MAKPNSKASLKEYVKNLAIVHNGEIVQNSSMKDVIASTKKHTYIIRTDANIDNIESFSENIKIIDDKSYELEVDNKITISDVINKFNDRQINVTEILSKRNKLEELFIELTQE